MISPLNYILLEYIIKGIRALNNFPCKKKNKRKNK